jgi:hypothetical protein
LAKKRHKGASIGGLGEALVKAGLADTKAVNKARVERRVENKTLGRDGLVQREEARRASNLERQQTLKDEARQREAALADSRLGGSAHQLLRQHTKAGSGPKRWYFVARDGRVPYLELPDMLTRLLGEGQAAIVESLGTAKAEHVVVVDHQALATLHKLDPELIRFWNHN